MAAGWGPRRNTAPITDVAPEEGVRVDSQVDPIVFQPGGEDGPPQVEAAPLLLGPSRDGP